MLQYKISINHHEDSGGIIVWQKKTWDLLKNRIMKNEVLSY